MRYVQLYCIAAHISYAVLQLYIYKAVADLNRTTTVKDAVTAAALPIPTVVAPPVTPPATAAPPTKRILLSRDCMYSSRGKESKLNGITDYNHTCLQEVFDHFLDIQKVVMR